MEQVNEQQQASEQQVNAKKTRVTQKNPRRVEAGRKSAALRKAKHEEVLERLRKAKEEPSRPPPDHVYPVYYVGSTIMFIVAAGGVYYYFNYYSSKPLPPPPTEPTKPNPFQME